MEMQAFAWLSPSVFYNLTAKVYFVHLQVAARVLFYTLLNLIHIIGMTTCRGLLWLKMLGCK